MRIIYLGTSIVNNRAVKDESSRYIPKIIIFK